MRRRSLLAAPALLLTAAQPLQYDTTPPPTIALTRGRIAPLSGWTVGLFDDFTSFPQSTTSEQVWTGAFTWLAAMSPGWYGQGQELIVNAHQAHRAGIPGAMVPFLSGGFSPFSCADSILRITAFRPTTTQLNALKTLDIYRSLFPPEQGGDGTHVRRAFTDGVMPVVSGGLCSAKDMTRAGYGHGYFECQLKAPVTANGDSTGMWPAFWLNYTQPDYTPEVDIFEQQVGAVPRKLQATLHWGKPKNSVDLVDVDTGYDLTQAFHTYGCLWTPHFIAIYFDGQLRGSFRLSDEAAQVYNGSSPLDIRLNFSLGWPWEKHQYWVSPEQLPATFEIDWVRWSHVNV